MHRVGSAEEEFSGIGGSGEREMKSEEREKVFSAQISVFSNRTPACIGCGTGSHLDFRLMIDDF